MQEIERGAKGEAGSSASAVEPCGDCEVEKGGSSSSTSSGDDLSDKENLPSAEPPKLGQKQNGRLRSQREKWKEAAPQIEASASFM